MRDDTEGGAEGMPSRAASVDSAEIEAVLGSSEAFELALLL